MHHFLITQLHVFTSYTSRDWYLLNYNVIELQYLTTENLTWIRGHLAVYIQSLTPNSSLYVIFTRRGLQQPHARMDDRNITDYKSEQSFKFKRYVYYE